MLSHIPNIAAVAAQLRDQVDKKADPEDLSDWLDSALAGAEGEHTSSTTGAPLCVRGCLLLQVLVHCGSATPALSALVGLLDRYSEALLTHASTAEHHVDLMLQLAVSISISTIFNIIMGLHCRDISIWIDFYRLRTQLIRTNMCFIFADMTILLC